MSKGEINCPLQNLLLFISCVIGMAVPCEASSAQIVDGVTNAFPEPAISDVALGNAYGSGLHPSQEQTRLIVGAFHTDTLQQVGQASRDAIDNWWSQTGAALVDDNLIARVVL